MDLTKEIAPIAKAMNRVDVLTLLRTASCAKSGAQLLERPLRKSLKPRCRYCREVFITIILASAINNRISSL